MTLSPSIRSLIYRGVKQTDFGRGPEFDESIGNCMQAALATVLGRPLEEVPHFLKENWEDPNWWDTMNQWLIIRYGVALMGFQAGDWTVPPVLHLMQGRTVRGSSHVVVGFGGKMIFDPHPNDEGLLTVETIEMFVVVNPLNVKI